MRENIQNFMAKNARHFSSRLESATLNLAICQFLNIFKLRFAGPDLKTLAELRLACGNTSALTG